MKNTSEISINTETYDINTDLSYDQKLKLFKKLLHKNILSKWEALNTHVNTLIDKQFHANMFTEINKLINDFAVKCVINSKVSDASFIEFEKVLDEYTHYVKVQTDLFYKNEEQELNNAQQYIDSEFHKLHETLKLMNKSPLNLNKQ